MVQLIQFNVWRSIQFKSASHYLTGKYLFSLTEIPKETTTSLLHHKLVGGVSIPKFEFDMFKPGSIRMIHMQLYNVKLEAGQVKLIDKSCPCHCDIDKLSHPLWLWYLSFPPTDFLRQSMPCDQPVNLSDICTTKVPWFWQTTAG